MSTDNKDMLVCKIDDPRIANYENRTRNGSTQVFYTGNDSRDWERYRAEEGGRKHGVIMHDKPDTIRIKPPEKHLYAQKIEGEWWWVNGCAECNGRPRDWMTYIECDKHNVCRTCGTPRSKLTEPPWGGKHGWQCKPCADAEKASLKEARLQAMADQEYDEWDFRYQDKVKCPHCGSAYQPDTDIEDGEQTCEICDGQYQLEVEYTPTYTTKLVGERLKPSEAA